MIGSRFFRQFGPLRHQEENLVGNLRAFQKHIFFAVTHGCTHYILLLYQSFVIISYCNEWNGMTQGFGHTSQRILLLAGLPTGAIRAAPNDPQKQKE